MPSSSSKSPEASRHGAVTEPSRNRHGTHARDRVTVGFRASRFCDDIVRRSVAFAEDVDALKFPQGSVLFSFSARQAPLRRSTPGPAFLSLQREKDLILEREVLSLRGSESRTKKWGP